MSNRLLGILLCLATAFDSAAAQAKQGVELTYIANEGFLITGGGKKILVDALLRQGIPEYYLRPDVQTLKKLEGAHPPYDAVDLVLATHFHRDHFDAGSVAAHLRANPKATFVSVHQAADLVAQQFPPGAREAARVLSTTPAYNQKTRLTVAGIPIEAVRLRHGQFENTGFLITLAGKTILHVGDADAEVVNFAAFGLGKQKIDVALIPYWYFLSDEGKRVVRERISAAKLIAIHIDIEKPDGELRRSLAQIRGEFPAVILATRAGERWTF